MLSNQSNGESRTNLASNRLCTVIAGALTGLLLLSLFGSIHYNLNGKTFNRKFIPEDPYSIDKLFVIKGDNIAVKGQYYRANHLGSQIEHRGIVNVIESDVSDVETEFSVLATEEGLLKEIRISANNDNSSFTITLPQVWKKNARIATITTIRIPKGKRLDTVSIDFPTADVRFNDLDAKITQLGVKLAVGDIIFDARDLETERIEITADVGVIEGACWVSKFLASTRVGDITLNLSMLGKEPEVETSIGTGSTLLHISEAREWRNIQSKHVAHTGSITLYYPRTWEGKIHAQTHVGRVSFSDEIQVTREQNGFVENTKEGLKGNGRSVLLAKTDVGEIVVGLE